MNRCMLRYKAGRLMFNQTPDPDGGGGSTPPAPTDPPAPPAPPAEDLGFPLNTPVAEMTEGQQAAYWRNESKKQQRIAESRKDYDAIKQERDTLVATHTSEEEKAIADAKAAGLAEGTAKNLKTAVRGHLRALTLRPVEEIDSALEFIDVSKFAGADGDLDDAKLEAFAKTLGASADGAGAPPIDPVREALERQQRGGGPAGGSIAAQEELEYQRLTGKK